MTIRALIIVFFLFLFIWLSAFAVGLKAQVPLALCPHWNVEQNSVEARAFFPSHVSIPFDSLHLSLATVTLSEYIRYPSITGKEREAGFFLKTRAEHLGLHTQELIAEDGTYNLSISLYPLNQGKPNIIFINHMDVVGAPDPEAWKYPPFDGVVAEGFIWGRGAYDNKGAAVAQLMALAAFVEEAKQLDWPFNVSLLSLSGEEQFHPGGAAYIADNHLELLNPIVFLGEGPSGVKGLLPSKPDAEVFAIAVSHKRALWLQLSLAYESTGHGSVPPNNYPNKDMVAAINNVLQKKQKVHMTPYNASLLQGLGDLEGGLKGFFMKNIHLLKPVSRNIIRKEPLYNSFFTNTISLTEIRNYSDAHNSIPTRVEAYLDCRLLPGQKTADFITKLQKQLGNPIIDIKILKETPDGVPSDPSHPVYSFLERSILQTYPGATVFPMMLPATIDSNFFRSKGLPVFCSVPILMNPDLLKKVHAPNERIPIQSLDNAVAILTHFIAQCRNYYVPKLSKSTELPDDDLNR